MDFNLALSEVSDAPSQPVSIFGQSDTEGSGSEASNTPPKKRRRENFTYECVHSTEDVDSARQYVKNLNSYSFNTRFSTSEGEKLMYFCKHDSKVKIYKSINDHNHTEKIKHGIPKATKDAILRFWAEGTRKPNPILRRLVEDAIATLTKMQLNNYLTQQTHILITKQRRSECFSLQEGWFLCGLLIK